MTDPADPQRRQGAAAADAWYRPSPQEQHVLKGAARDTLDRLVPMLTITLRPTDVDPRSPAGPLNMKRVLHSVLNDEGAKITIKDEDGRSLETAQFARIYPQIQGPFADGSIQIEYHEQATLGWLGDVFWSLGWFLKQGVLGIPRQMTGAALQAVGVSFLLEHYYRQWLISLLDQLERQGLLPGYVDPETREDRWETFTEIAGRNIVLRPRRGLISGKPSAAE